MLIDPANGSPSYWGTQIRKWGMLLDPFHSPAPYFYRPPSLVDLLPKRSLNLPTCFPSTGPSHSRLLTKPRCSPLLTVLSAFFSLLFKLFFPLEPEQPVRSPHLMESLPHLKTFNGFCWLLDRAQASTTWQRQYSPNTPRTPLAFSADMNTDGATSLVQACGLWVGVTRVILSRGTCS